MKTLKHLLILALAVALYSCKQELPVTYVPQHLIEVVPYTNSQKILITSTAGDSIYATIKVINDFAEVSTCVSCKPYEKQEYYYYQLNSDTSTGFGQLMLIALLSPARNNFYLNLYSPFNSEDISGFLLNTENQLSQVACISQQICHASFNSNSHSYTNVTELSSDHNIAKIFYSKTDGLIQYNHKNGTVYYLQKL